MTFRSRPICRLGNAELGNIIIQKLQIKKLYVTAHPDLAIVFLHNINYTYFINRTYTSSWILNMKMKYYHTCKL